MTQIEGTWRRINSELVGSFYFAVTLDSTMDAQEFSGICRLDMLSPTQPPDAEPLAARNPYTPINPKAPESS